MGEASAEAPAVRAASERIAKAARAAGKPVLFFVGALADASAMRAIGGSGFVYASDQSLMRQAAAKALADLKTLD
jgi:2-keto-3-deoxy-L-rhamnonate aldolase RhmA